jgi:cytidine deaminase
VRADSLLAVAFTLFVSVPCGACLQFILEFGEEVVVIAVQPDRKFKLSSIRQLAPLCFSPAELAKEKV